MQTIFIRPTKAHLRSDRKRKIPWKRSLFPAFGAPSPEAQRRGIIRSDQTKRAKLKFPLGEFERPHLNTSGDDATAETVSTSEED